MYIWIFATVHMMLHNVLIKLHKILLKLHNIRMKLHKVLMKLHKLLIKLHQLLMKLHTVLWSTRPYEAYCNSSHGDFRGWNLWSLWSFGCSKFHSFLTFFVPLYPFEKAWPHIGAVDKSAFWNKNRQKVMKLSGVRVAPPPLMKPKLHSFEKKTRPLEDLVYFCS